MPDRPMPRLYWSPTVGLITRTQHGDYLAGYGHRANVLPAGLPDDATELTPVRYTLREEVSLSATELDEMNRNTLAGLVKTTEKSNRCPIPSHVSGVPHPS